ncbi:hypothetical protein KFK09_002971 [Dendrobium nobile]|uniref:Uncharacterized protein n=1 Tax=Dendrobium nobile TaxID=94219 RepID=A0A8T3C2V5_DENNO|nr:hypothetical protein KFK09_002971 [Dendrobium nobile]
MIHLYFTNSFVFFSFFTSVSISLPCPWPWPRPCYFSTLFSSRHVSLLKEVGACIYSSTLLVPFIQSFLFLGAHLVF